MSDREPTTNFIKWLLEVDIRWKNGLSVLAALLSVAMVYLAARHSEWFRELEGRGNRAVAVALTTVLLISFLSVWLVLSAAIGVWTRHGSAKRAIELKRQELTRLRTTLDSLTDWQRSFVLRFIVGDTMQIKEWEIGGYEAVWGPEVEVLVAKGIIKRHFSGVLEIAPEYWRYLKAFWDPATETLN